MITKLTLEHALRVARNMRESDRREVMATRWNDNSEEFALECYRVSGVSWVAINKDGEPVVMGGFAFNSPGVATAWMVGTDKWLSVALEVSRFSKKSIRTLFSGNDIHRVQAFSALFHVESHRWLKVIGLTPEHLLPKWGKDEDDFILFEALKGS